MNFARPETIKLIEQAKGLSALIHAVDIDRITTDQLEGATWALCDIVEKLEQSLNLNHSTERRD